MLKDVLNLMKTNKLVRYLLLLAVVLVLGLAVVLLSPKEETPNNPANSSQGVGYDEFSETEKNDGEKAAKLAEEHYIKQYGTLRETSFFYAELLSQGIYHVVGADALDGRDVTFIEYDVDLNTNTVKESVDN